jgi:hypothetical protein
MDELENDGMLFWVECSILHEDIVNSPEKCVEDAKLAILDLIDLAVAIMRINEFKLYLAEAIDKIKLLLKQVEDQHALQPIIFLVDVGRHRHFITHYIF